MPSSKQQPLASPKGGDPHNFSQSRISWEAAVFDDAVYFFTLELVPRDRHEFKTFSEAVEYARDLPRCLVYGVTQSERSALFDREKWNEWLEREKLTRLTDAPQNDDNVPKSTPMRNIYRKDET